MYAVYLDEDLGIKWFFRLKEGSEYLAQGKSAATFLNYGRNRVPCELREGSLLRF